VEVRRLRDRADREGVPIDWPDPAAAFHAGDRIVVVVRNPTPFAVDVTLLDVAPDATISALFPDPERGETSRLAANAELRVPPIRVQGAVSGPDHLVVIATRARKLRQPADFSCLEQPGLEAALATERKRGVPAGRGLGSPLGQLLQRSQYGTGTRTGREDLDDTAIVMYSWRFVAGSRR
jgi:hypothetical protein